MAIKFLNVYDLDGVLVDSAHRYKNKPDGTIDLDHWRANRNAQSIARDRLLDHTWQYVDDCVNPYCYVVICTSREYTDADAHYINTVLGAPDKLIMRPVGNTEPDGILKRRQLQRLFNLRQFANLPRVLWEDNPKNIDALRDLFSRTIYVQSKQGS